MPFKKGQQIRLTHGLSYSPEHKSWEEMRQRCCNINNSHYDSYGGRGITICRRWNMFENFYEDMGKRPLRMSLDRINNNGNYEPSNCRWATKSEQACNRRNSRYLTYGGETYCIAEWARKISIPYSTLYHRILRGHSVAKAINWEE